MKVVLTGGIGVGKSTVIEAMQGKGIVFANIDQFVRETYTLPHIIEQLVQLFGDEIVMIWANGAEINRYQLWQKAKWDLRLLEQITLPEVERKLDTFHAEHEKDTTLVEMPLLYEIEQRHPDYAFVEKFDRIVCLHCADALQRARVFTRTKTLRPHMQDEEIEERMREIIYTHQLSHERKIALTQQRGGVCIDTWVSRETMILAVEKALTRSS